MNYYSASKRPNRGSGVVKRSMEKFLRQSTLDPTKSAWEFFNAPFDYAATPIEPLGFRITIHKKPSVRNTWDFRGKYGWSLGCSLEHYRCQRVAPKYTPKPEDCVLHGLQTLTCALEDAPIQMCDEKICAISTLHKLFGQWTKNVPTYP